MELESHHGQLATSEEENVGFLTLLCKMHRVAVGFVTGTGKCVRQVFVWLQIARACNSGIVLYKWICVRRRCKETLILLFVKSGFFYRDQVWI